MTIRPPNRIVTKALFGLTTPIIKLRVKSSNITRKRLTPLSSIKLSVFNKAGIFILLSLMVISSKTYAEKINTEKFFNSKIGREVEVVEGEIIVRFKPRLETGAIRKMNEAFGSQLRKEIKSMNIHRIRLGKGKKIRDMLEMYRKDPNVLFAEPNYIARALTIPNDPSFPQQWGLSRIYAPEAWDIEKGNSNVIIAIVDTGIDLDHPDLDEKIVPGYDFVNEDSGPMDDNGHGTHCAGIAAAESNNGQGITGVTWGSKLMPVKVLDSDGTGTYSDVAEGIIYAADKGARVINLSLGAYSYSQTLQDAIDYAYQKGCVIIAAAGNDNTNEPLYPAACGNVIGVAATDQNDRRWTSSNYGDYIDVCAPGVNIYSTFLDNVYMSASGTSASAPFVSGLAGLILSQNNTLVNYQVENKITQTADDLGTTGRDDYFGSGRINIYSSLLNKLTKVHDISIYKVEIDSITLNQRIQIKVIIKNEGDYDEENVNIDAFIDQQQIENTQIIDLMRDEMGKVIFYYDVPLVENLYKTLKVKIKINLDEIDIKDNEKSILLNFLLKDGQIKILHSRYVHQWITEKGIDLVGMYYNQDPYNSIYSGYETLNYWKINIKQGSVDEDDPLLSRCPMHGYNPVNNDGFAGSKYGNAYEWGYNSTYNQMDFTDALNSYKNGDYVNAFYYLGYAVHLLEDMSVPAHTHVDAHVGGDGDDYESYCVSNALPTTTETPIMKNSVKEYFDGLAWKSYYANRFQGTLSESNPPVPDASEIGKMFTMKYIYPFPYIDKWWELYNNPEMDGAFIGDYDRSMRSNEWWPCKGDTGNIYIEKTDTSKPKIYIDCDDIQIDNSTNKYSLRKLFVPKLIPYAIRYAAGYMIYFCNQLKPINCSILSPNRGGWYKGQITISANAPQRWSSVGIDFVHFQYSTDHTNWNVLPADFSSSGGWSINWDSNSSGINDSSVWVRARSCDKGGLYSNWDECDSSFGVDNSIPNIGSISCWKESSHSTQINENAWQNDGTVSFAWNNPSSPSDDTYYYEYDTNSGNNSISGSESNTTNEYVNNYSLTEGTRYFHVRPQNGAGTWGTERVFCIQYDGSKPGLVYNLKSTSHNTSQWSKDTTIDVSWSSASDSGGSGLDGYSIEWSHSPSTLPDTVKDVEQNVTTTTSPPLTDGNDLYFHIRSVDNAENWDSTGGHLGPFYVDTTAPSSSVANLTKYKAEASFTISWSGSDGPGYGIESYDVQYKDGAGTWTDWLMDTTLTSKTFGPTLPISVQDEHTYYFRCRAKDKLGNQQSYPSSADTFTTVDLTPPNAPIVSSTSHNEDKWNIINNDPVFNWTVPPDFSHIDGFSFKLNHTQNYVPDTVKDCEETTTSKQYIDVADGIWYFHIRAKDNAGNWGATYTYGPVKIDLTAPTFSAISPSADPAKEGDITVTVVASEEMSVVSSSVTQSANPPVSLNMSSSDGKTWTGTYTVISGHDGMATISVSGKDLVGNEGSDLTTFVVDTVPPTKPEISSSHPKDSPFSNNNPSFNWTSSTDSLSGVAGYSYALNQIENYDLDVATETTGTSASFTKQDGTWWFHLRGVDKAGNPSEIDRYKFIIDTTSPTFTASSSKDPAKEGDVTITVQASEELKEPPTVNVKQKDQVSVKKVEVSSKDNITWTGMYSVVPEYDGTAIINVVSGVDLADNMGTGSGSFEVDTIEPTGSISVSPPPPLRTGEFQIQLSIKDASNIPQKPSLSYTPSGGSSISVPLTGSDKSWSGTSYIESTTPDGTAEFSFSAIDAASNVGMTITQGETFAIDTTINFAEGGTSSNNDGTKVEVPKNAVSEDINVRITALDPNLSIIIEADNNLVDDKGINPIKTTNLYRSITAIGTSGTEIKRFDKPIAISIPYPDSDQNGVVDGTNIREASLRMFYLDENQAKWLLVPDSLVDPVGNNVTARVSHFSIYTIMQLSPASSLSEVFGYPNPCYVKRDGYVRISNIPLDAKQVKIYIYNVAGELIRTLEEGDGIEELAGSKIGKWDGRNESDEMVASGIYVYLIKSRGTKKTEKIAIFW